MKQQQIARHAKERDGDEEKWSKRNHASYEIAGVYYSDINKVKSKARAILNRTKDGEQLTGNDSEFIWELLEMHEKGEAKLRDF